MRRVAELSRVEKDSDAASATESEWKRNATDESSLPLSHQIWSNVERLQGHQANHTVMMICECLPTNCENISLLKDACTSASSTNRLDH
jgi:hypothetical protein